MKVTQKLALAILTVLGLIVGVWAYFFPEGFFDIFPGFPGNWVTTDGPFNEHLVRDVGAFYIALGLASGAGMFIRSPPATRVLGVAWTAFGVLHLTYHAGHTEVLEPADAFGNVFSLAVLLIGAVILLLPVRTSVSEQTYTQRPFE